MNKSSQFHDNRVVGIDLGKQYFHVYGEPTSAQPSMDRQFSRIQLRGFLTNLPPSLIAMEACAGAHYWGRCAEEAGHSVRLIAPQFVKPYVKSNKNDRVS